MKKMLLSVLVAIAICTIGNAQIRDSVKYDGFNATLYSHKIMTLICRPQTAGYIDSNQIKVTRVYKYTTKTEFHTKAAYEKFTETLNENRLKATAEAKVGFDYGTESGSATVGFESDYFSKLLETVKTISESSKDITNESTDEYNIEYKPNTSIQLYECVVNIPGEYNRVYASPKVSNQKFILPYKITIDYSDALRRLYQVIKDCNVGTDQGEWGFFNNIAGKAFTQYSAEPTNTWNNFLQDLATLWTDKEDQGSWSIVKSAAIGALNQKQPINQFRYFCTQLTNIREPSHNDWAWARITDFAKRYQ